MFFSSACSRETARGESSGAAIGGGEEAKVSTFWPLARRAPRHRRVGRTLALSPAARPAPWPLGRRSCAPPHSRRSRSSTPRTRTSSWPRSTSRCAPTLARHSPAPRPLAPRLPAPSRDRPARARAPQRQSPPAGLVLADRLGLVRRAHHHGPLEALPVPPGAARPRHRPQGPRQGASAAPARLRRASYGRGAPTARLLAPRTRAGVAPAFPVCTRRSRCWRTRPPPFRSTSSSSPSAWCVPAAEEGGARARTLESHSSTHVSPSCSCVGAAAGAREHQGAPGARPPPPLGRAPGVLGARPRRGHAPHRRPRPRLRCRGPHTCVFSLEPGIPGPRASPNPAASAVRRPP